MVTSYWSTIAYWWQMTFCLSELWSHSSTQAKRPITQCNIYTSRKTNLDTTQKQCTLWMIHSSCPIRNGAKASRFVQMYHFSIVLHRDWKHLVQAGHDPFINLSLSLICISTPALLLSRSHEAPLQGEVHAYPTDRRTASVKVRRWIRIGCGKTRKDCSGVQVKYEAVDY